MKIDDGGPAFPDSDAYSDDKGMTLRDYFAAKAPPMPEDLYTLAMGYAQVNSSVKTHGEKSKTLLATIAEWNYMYADAMLAAREPKTEGGAA